MPPTGKATGGVQPRRSTATGSMRGNECAANAAADVVLTAQVSRDFSGVRCRPGVFARYLNIARMNAADAMPRKLIAATRSTPPMRKMWYAVAKRTEPGLAG